MSDELESKRPQWVGPWRRDNFNRCWWRIYRVGCREVYDDDQARNLIDRVTEPK